MGRMKIKDGIAMCVYIDKETKRKMHYLAGELGMSVSAWVELQAERSYEATDLGKKQRLLKAEIATSEAWVADAKVELEKTTKIQLARKSRFQAKKEQYIQSLLRCFLEKRDINDIMDFAKNQSLVLGQNWSAEELVDEAEALFVKMKNPGSQQ
jgi:hypothetical protein